MYHERRQRDELSNFSRVGLSTAQKYSLNEVEHYGYQAVFVREIDSQQVVIAMQGNRALTINEHGDVDMSPEIDFRK